MARYVDVCAVENGVGVCYCFFFLLLSFSLIILIFIGMFKVEASLLYANLINGKPTGEIPKYAINNGPFFQP